MGVMAHGPMGVSDTRPKYRMVPFRDDFAKRGVQGLCMGLSANPDKLESVPQNLAVAYLDGHVHGNQTKFLKCFVDDTGKVMAKDHKWWFFTRTQTSAEDGKERVQQVAGATSCTEFCHVISFKALDVPVINRLYCSGDNRSDTFGPFEKPPIDGDMVFKVTHNERSALLGPALRENGGSIALTAGEAEDKAKATDTVPLNYHGHDKNELEELLNALNAKGAVEIGAMDGTMCYLCCCMKIAYVGITYTADLKERLEKFVCNLIFRAFQTPGHALFEPAMVEQMNQAGIPTSITDSSGGPANKRARGGKNATAVATNAAAASAGAEATESDPSSAAVAVAGAGKANASEPKDSIMKKLAALDKL